MTATRALYLGLASMTASVGTGAFVGGFAVATFVEISTGRPWWAAFAEYHWIAAGELAIAGAGWVAWWRLRRS